MLDNLVNNHIFSKIYPKYFSLVLKIYIGLFFAMGGCSSIKHNMKSSINSPAYTSQHSIPARTYSPIDELDKFVNNFEITNHPFDHLFFDYRNRLQKCETIVNEHFSYINTYKFIEKLESKNCKEIIENIHFKSIIQRENELNTLDKRIKELADCIAETGVEFDIAARNIFSVNEDVEKEQKKENEILLEKKRKLIEEIKIKNNKKLKNNNSIEIKKCLSIDIAIKKNNHKVRNKIVNKIENYKCKKSIKQIENKEKELHKKIKEIEEKLEMLSHIQVDTDVKKVLNFLCKHKQYIYIYIMCREDDKKHRICCNDNNIAYNKHYYIALGDLAVALTNVFSKDLYRSYSKDFSKVLQSGSQLIINDIISNSSEFPNLIDEDTLPFLANTILEDTEKKDKYNIVLDWNTLSKLVIRNKIDITMLFYPDLEKKQKINMLELFFEKGDIDSASKLIAYSTIFFSKNTYSDLIKLLNHSTSNDSLITLFQRLIEPNNCFDQCYTKHIESFLNHIGKSERCACTIKKSNYIPISPFDTPPPSRSPSPPPEPDKPSPMCVSCAYDKAKALYEKHNHSANYNINSNTSLSTFPISRGKFMISESEDNS